MKTIQRPKDPQYILILNLYEDDESLKNENNENISCYESLWIRMAKFRIAVS